MGLRIVTLAIKMWSDELCEFCEKSWGDVDGQSLTQRIQDPRTAGRAEAEKMLGLSDLSGPSEVNNPKTVIATLIRSRAVIDVAVH